MRDKYVEELINEVMGPRNGPEEIIVGADPYTEYVTGVIIPQKCKKGEKNPDSEILVPETDDSEEDNSDAETSPELPNELDPRMKPKSFGISYHKEGVPLNLPGSKGEQLSDSLFIKENLRAFLPGSRQNV